jgi:hypothetical protein
MFIYDAGESLEDYNGNLSKCLLWSLVACPIIKIVELCFFILFKFSVNQFFNILHNFTPWFLCFTFEFKSRKKLFS